MLASIIGNYLVTNGSITTEQQTMLMDELKMVRVKLGLIAVAEGMMTKEQADKVNHIQAIKDMRFGDIAVSEGFLTDAQVQTLLKLQGNPYLSLAQALENLNIMNIDKLNECLKAYANDYGISTSGIEDLKSDDIERILPLFIPADAAEYNEIACIALKTIMRCVDSDVYPSTATLADKLDVNKIALQEIDGTMPVTLGLAGADNDLLSIASIFGKEDFECVDMDALDACAELCNCINGLYASALSQKGVTMELLAPEFSDDTNGITGDEMFILPITVCGQTSNLVISIGSKITIA